MNVQFLFLTLVKYDNFQSGNRTVNKKTLSKVPRIIFSSNRKQYPKISKKKQPFKQHSYQIEPSKYLKKKTLNILILL